MADFRLRISLNIEMARLLKQICLLAVILKVRLASHQLSLLSHITALFILLGWIWIFKLWTFSVEAVATSASHCISQHVLSIRSQWVLRLITNRIAILRDGNKRISILPSESLSLSHRDVHYAWMAQHAERLMVQLFSCWSVHLVLLPQILHNDLLRFEIFFALGC